MQNILDLPAQSLQGRAVEHERVVVRIKGEVHEGAALVGGTAFGGSCERLEDVRNEWLCHSNRPMEEVLENSCERPKQ